MTMGTLIQFPRREPTLTELWDDVLADRGIVIHDRRAPAELVAFPTPAPAPDSFEDVDPFDLARRFATARHAGGRLELTERERAAVDSWRTSMGFNVPRREPVQADVDRELDEYDRKQLELEERILGAPDEAPVSVSEAQRFSGWCDSTILNRIRAGQLTGTKQPLPGGRFAWTIPAAEVRRIREEKETIERERREKWDALRDGYVVRQEARTRRAGERTRKGEL